MRKLKIAGLALCFLLGFLWMVQPQIIGIACYIVGLIAIGFGTLGLSYINRHKTTASDPNRRARTKTELQIIVALGLVFIALGLYQAGNPDAWGD